MRKVCFSVVFFMILLAAFTAKAQEPSLIEPSEAEYTSDLGLYTTLEAPFGTSGTDWREVEHVYPGQKVRLNVWYYFESELSGKKVSLKYKASGSVKKNFKQNETVYADSDVWCQRSVNMTIPRKTREDTSFLFSGTATIKKVECLNNTNKMAIGVISRQVWDAIYNNSAN